MLRGVDSPWGCSRKVRHATNYMMAATYLVRVMFHHREKVAHTVFMRRNCSEKVVVKDNMVDRVEDTDSAGIVVALECNTEGIGLVLQRKIDRVLQPVTDCNAGVFQVSDLRLSTLQ